MPTAADRLERTLDNWARLLEACDGDAEQAERVWRVVYRTDPPNRRTRRKTR